MDGAAPGPTFQELWTLQSMPQEGAGGQGRWGKVEGNPTEAERKREMSLFPESKRASLPPVENVH